MEDDKKLEELSGSQSSARFTAPLRAPFGSPRTPFGGFACSLPSGDIAINVVLNPNGRNVIDRHRFEAAIERIMKNRMARAEPKPPKLRKEKIPTVEKRPIEPNTRRSDIRIHCARKR